jgi:hypothetical protein
VTTIVAQPSRELTEFLLELAVASQRRAMYPGGHPSLETSEQRVLDRLGPLLMTRHALTVGVARDQLIIDGVATDNRNNLLRALAGRMHAHRIAGVKFIPGLTPQELTDLLSRLAREADGSLMEPNWAHVQLYRQAYDRLTLVEDEPGANTGEPRRVPRAAQLWLALAQAALNVASDANAPANTDPKVMADAINQNTTMKSTDAYEQVVVGYLLQIADELRTTEGADTMALRGRVSSLVANLSPEALQRLLTMGGDLGQRRAFLLDATAGMAIEAVLAIAVAAANVSRRVISQPLMRMLVKLASHAQRGAPPLRAATDAAFRDQVRELVEGWTLPDPTSELYSKALDDLAQPVDGAPIISGITQVGEPERIFEISLELRNTAPPLWDATQALIGRGDITWLLDTLDRCTPDNPLPGVIRTRIATPAHFRLLLNAATVDVKRIGDFARRVGEPATELLLDALIESNSRAARRRILDVLGALGEAIGPAIVRRLPGSPWYAQRNLLILMSTLETWPEEFMAADYVGHSDVRVRREALKLLLKHSQTRVYGITVAMADSDPQLIRMGLDAAVRECPPAVVPRLAAKLQAGTLPPELEVMAIHAIGSTSVPAAFTCLWGLAIKRTRWLRRDKLVPKSRAMLAALSTLAKQWPEDPKVVKIVASAARSGDREIRRAVGAVQ